MAEVLTPTWASGQNYLQIIDCGCCGVDAHRRTEGGGKLRQLVWPFRNQTKKVALLAAACEFQTEKLQNRRASTQALTGQMTLRAESVCAGNVILSGPLTWTFSRPRPAAHRRASLSSCGASAPEPAASGPRSSLPPCPPRTSAGPPPSLHCSPPRPRGAGSWSSCSSSSRTRCPC